MRKLFSLVFIAIAMVSCSDDDGTPAVVDTPQVLQTKQTIYDGTAVEEFIVTDYSAGKPVTMKFYDAQNTLMASTSFSYTTGHGLIERTITSSAGGTELFRTTYTYDGSERIEKIVSDGENPSVTNINFSEDIITLVKGNQSRTFYLNENNIVYKETASNNTYELIFDGLNPVSAFTGSGTKTFEYDNEHNPAVLGLANITGEYKPNAVIRATYLADAETSTATKYVTKETLNNEVYKYNYTFDGNGRPTIVKTLRNDVLQSQLEYVYSN